MLQLGFPFSDQHKDDDLLAHCCQVSKWKKEIKKGREW